MLISYPLLLGLTLGNDAAATTIGNYYNFIVNSALAGTAIITMCTMYPLVFQHIQEVRGSYTSAVRTWIWRNWIPFSCCSPSAPTQPAAATLTLRCR